MKINKKNKLKKTFLLGAMATATIAAPLAIAISCGTDSPAKSPVAPSPIIPIETENKFAGEFSSKAVEEKFLKITTVIEPGEFAGETKLISISLPDVLTIGVGAFKDSNLVSISTPSVITIGDSAFESAQLQSQTDLILDNVETIGNRAFATSELTKIKMEKVKTIGDDSFETAELQTLEIPKAIQIGNFAFKSAKITSLAMPDALSIGHSAFQDSELTTLEIPNITMIGNSAFTNSKLTGAFSLQNVTTIGQDAFKDSTFTSVHFPNVKTISTNAFEGSTAIVSITLEKVTTIGDHAFNPNNINIDINAPLLTNIGEYGFGTFTGWVSPNHDISWGQLTNVGAGAFEKVENIGFDDVIDFNSLQVVGANAFKNYNHSELSIENITSIEAGAFSEFGGANAPQGPTTLIINQNPEDVLFIGNGSPFGYTATGTADIIVKVPADQINAWETWRVDTDKGMVFPSGRTVTFEAI